MLILYFYDLVSKGLYLVNNLVTLPNDLYVKTCKSYICHQRKKLSEVVQRTPTFPKHSI